MGGSTEVRATTALRDARVIEPGAGIDALVGALTPWRSGPCQVSIDYEGEGARGVFTLASEWNVRATRELLEQLELLAGPGNVSVRYGPPPGAGAHEGALRS